MSEPRITLHRPVEVTPFWRCLHGFFTFPLGGAPLFRLLLLSLGLMLARWLPIPTPIDILLGGLVVWVIFLRYAFLVLERTAFGVMDASRYDAEALDNQLHSPYRLLALYLILGIPVGLASLVGPNSAQVAALLVALVLPASTMSLGISSSLLQAINPLAMLQLMTTIGRPYLALWFFVETLSVGSFFAGGMLARLAPGWLALGLFNFVLMYFTLVSYRLMGYALYQYHDRLGLQPVAQAGSARNAGARTSDESASNERIAELIAEGNIKDATWLAYEEQRSQPDNCKARDRYHRLLKLGGDNAAYLSYGQAYIASMLGLGAPDKALPVYQRCQELDPEFRCEHSQQVLALAQAAHKVRKHDLALQIMRRFDRHFPRAAEVAEVYLLSARILCEHKKQDSLARQILTVLLTRYPEHAAAKEAQQLLQMIDRLQAAPAPAAG